MKLHEIYLEIRPEDIAYVNFIFESYEGVGIIRTVLRQAQHSEPGRTVDRKKGVIVLLAVDDFLPIARAILASLQSEIPVAEIARPDNPGEDWLLREIATESSPKS